MISYAPSIVGFDTERVLGDYCAYSIQIKKTRQNILKRLNAKVLLTFLVY